MRRLIIGQGVVTALLTAGLGHSQSAAPSATVNPGASTELGAGTSAPSAAPVDTSAAVPGSAPPVTAAVTSSQASPPIAPSVGVSQAPVSTEARSGSTTVTASPAVAVPTSVTSAAPPPAQTPASSATPASTSSELVDSSAAESEEAQASADTVLEDPEPSQGHFIALGVHGVGAMAFDEYRGTRAPTFGPGISLRFGEAVTDWLDISLAFALAFTSGDVDDSVTFGRFGVQSQWYLTERMFVQAGFGATNAQGKDPDDHDLVRGRYGDVYLTGIGYNLYLSDNDQSGGWVLTPVLTAEVGPDRTFTTTALWLGVEVSWWTGLSRDKLNLSLSKAYDKASE